MNQSTMAPATGELGLCAWFGFWWPFAALALLAVLGAFFASADNAPGDDACGLALGLAAVALAFLRLKRHFDGGGGWVAFLLVDDLPNLVLVIVVFAALALAGLFVAANVAGGALQAAGVALALASAAAVLLSIKHVFDVAERRD